MSHLHLIPLPAQVEDIAGRIGTFVRELRRELNELARQAGVFAPHAPRDCGRLGLSHVGRAAAFLAVGYSMLGPIVHCAAPDEGNIHLLDWWRGRISGSAISSRWRAALPAPVSA